MKKEKSIATQEFKLLMDSLGENLKQLTEIFGELAEKPGVSLVMKAQILVNKSMSIINKAISMAKMNETTKYLIPSLEKTKVFIEETQWELEEGIIMDFVLKP